jgi:hypothetical protein
MYKCVGILGVLAIAGCATNEAQVRERGAIDLKCDAAEVAVKLVERPYVGITRYEADGCGETRTYECRARAYSAGLPIGERACRREGDAHGGTADVSGGKYGF